MKRTSETDPIILNPIATGISGENILYLTFAPGKITAKSKGARCGWHRNLEADLIRMREVYGIDEIISLLEPAEAIQIGLADYPESAAHQGIVTETTLSPICPFPQQPLPEFDAFIHTILQSLDQGRNVAVHCLGGLGRGGTIVSAVLIASGQSAEEAISWVQQQRPGSIKRMNQQNFLKRYAQYLHTP